MGSAPSRDATGRNVDLVIGQRLRERRRQLGIGLRELSAATGISLGLLSEIERGLSSPTVRNLQLLCGALEVTVSSLFRDVDGPEDDADGHVLPLDRRFLIDLGSLGMRKELLTPRATPGMQAMLVHVDAGGGSGSESYAHGGEEWGMVLSGQFELEVDGRAYRLQAGDCFRFDSELAHRYRNPGPGLTQVLWVLTEPLY